ncbi:MAG: response regulator [Gemmataceae bacterium]
MPSVLDPAYGPRLPQGAPVSQIPGNKDLPRSGQKTILVADDEALVRAVLRRILEANGYLVLEASQGMDAMTLAQGFEAPIHLLISDLSLPNMSGLDVAERVRDMHPETRILLVSGFLDTEVPAETTYPLLLKPFTAETLLEHVRRLLEQG